MGGEMLQQAVCFADISGSTQLYEKLGDEAALALVERILGTMSQATIQNGGRVVKLLGDAVLAVFTSVENALSATREMHMHVRRQTGAQGGQGMVELHSGVHWGEVIPVSDDVYGDAVNVASRLSRLAGPGQILSSIDTLEAWEGKQSGQTRFLTRMHLEGGGREIEVHELIWDPGDLTMVTGTLTRLVRGEENSLLVRMDADYWEMNQGKPVLTIGRTIMNDVVVDRAWVSRNHAKVELIRGRFLLKDWSSNGTYVHLPFGKCVFLRQDEMALEGAGKITLGRKDMGGDQPVIGFQVRRSN